MPKHILLHLVPKIIAYANSAVNVALVQRNWHLGKRISEEILKGDNRAEYGAEVIVRLAKELQLHGVLQGVPGDFPRSEWKIRHTAQLDALPCAPAGK